MEGIGRIWGFPDPPRRSSARLALSLLVLSEFCLFGGRARADQSGDAQALQTGTYVFVRQDSTVVKTGGFAGVYETYFVVGRFQLTIDTEMGAASFDAVDAKLTAANGEAYARSLDDVFNMTGLSGLQVDDTTVEFVGKTADGTDSDVRLTLALGDDSARLVGKTTPPPNSADMFFYDLDAVALRKYAGGTGEPNTPYLIGTAEQMNAVGAEPNDWDKHFRLVADIDLGGYRGTDFNIIAPAGKGVYFTGLFDGGGHTISNFTYGPTDVNSVALFGNVRGRIENIGLIDPNIEAGTRSGVAPLVDWLNKGSMSGCYVRGGSVCGHRWVGGLVAYNTGTVTDCFSTAAVTGEVDVGGLAGDNAGAIAGCYATGSVTGASHVGGLLGFNDGTITGCSSSGDVAGGSNVGGLVGNNRFGIIWECSSTGRATGLDSVAGLVGRNSSVISSCYSSGDVSGEWYVGGLVGRSYGVIADCYSISDVLGEWVVGGLVGLHAGEISTCYSAGGVTANLKAGGLVGFGLPEAVFRSFWDIETSGQATSAGGIGKTTTEMQSAATFLEAGWDFVGETDNGTEDIWRISEGLDYPRLSWEKYGGGTGTARDPYQIWTAEQLNAIGAEPNDWDKHFKLMDDVDLSEYTGTDFNIIGRDYERAFTGVFDGGDHIISNFTYVSTDVNNVGLFGCVGTWGIEATIKNLGLIDPNVDAGTGICVGSLVAEFLRGTVTNCYVRGGSVSGNDMVGGLVGWSSNTIFPDCILISNSYSTATVSGNACVGGLVGANLGVIANCYAGGSVAGGQSVGALVGSNGMTMPVGGRASGTITKCYATGRVSGTKWAGGLLGHNWVGDVTASFWDVETSGQATSGGGTGKTTAEMQTAKTFLDAGWDFVGETQNGTEDIWWILEGRDYPRL